MEYRMADITPRKYYTLQDMRRAMDGLWAERLQVDEARVSLLDEHIKILSRKLLEANLSEGEFDDDNLH